jgi:hypothetical protein
MRRNRLGWEKSIQTKHHPLVEHHHLLTASDEA